MDAVSEMNQKRLRRLAKRCGKYLHWILLMILLFSIFIGVIYLVAELRVNLTTVVKPTKDHLWDRQRIFLSDLYQAKEFTGLAVSGYIYGILHLVMAAFAGYLLFLRMQGRGEWKRWSVLLGFVGMLANCSYLLLVYLLGVQRATFGLVTMQATVSPHFTVWIGLLLYGFLYAIAYFGAGKRRK